MGVFSRFGGLINLNTQQPLKEDSERSQNVKSNSGSKKDINNDAPAKKKVYYFDKDVELKQDDLWHEAEKKHPWYDAPPKVKVTTKKGICHMNIEFTVGLTPPVVYRLMTNPTGRNNSSGFFDMDKWLDLMKTKSRKVLMEDGPKQIVKSEKIVSRDFLWWSIPIPITLIDEENQKDFTTKYKKEKLMFMKMFEGNYKVEPIYVDAERLCKQKMPKSQEDYIECSREYMKCSNGQGKIASKVIMEQCFQPYPLFNLMPPLSWYIQGITIKTTKNMLKWLQSKAKVFREAELIET